MLLKRVTKNSCWNSRRAASLLPQSLQTHIRLSFLLHHFTNCHFKVLLSHMHSPLSQGKHASFSAYSLALSPTCIHHLFCNSIQINVPQQIHFARVNFHDCHTILRIGIEEFNLSVNTARTE